MVKFTSISSIIMLLGSFISQSYYKKEKCGKI